MSGVMDLMRKNAMQSANSELGAPIPELAQSNAVITSRMDAGGIKFEIPALPDLAPGAQQCSLIAGMGPDLQSGMSTILHVVGGADGEVFTVQPGAKSTEIKTLPGAFESAAQLDEMVGNSGTLYVFYMLVPQGNISQALRVKVDFTSQPA